MRIEAFPARFVAVSDGVTRGEEHVVLFLEPAGKGEVVGFALHLADARRLYALLGVILPQAQQIQSNLTRDN
jgi:hypothetical protein